MSARIVTGLIAVGLLAACAPYEAEPTSVYQWEKRQERIQREEAERLRRCETMDKQSERYARECASTGARQ